MSQTGGVCRVCGTALAPPLVACPRCETPHHRDCWDYNAGCSTYGCGEHVPAVVPDALPAPRAVSSAELYFDLDPRTNPAIAAVIVLGILRLTPPVALVPLLALSLVAIVLAYGARVFGAPGHSREVTRLLEGESEAVRLETKALAALIGAGAPQQLAQAYALFEQRHPRRALSPPQQTALAFELAGAGYDVLAFEAFDKALRLRGVDARKLTARRDDLIAQEPTYAMLPLDGGPGAPDRPAFAQRGNVAALRRTLVDEVDGDRHVIVSLSPAGWPWEARHQLTDVAGALSRTPADGWYMAGPFPRDVATMVAGKLWDAGHPTALVPPGELPDEHAPTDLLGVQLSQAGARLRTAAGERVLPWSDVTGVIYGLVVVQQATEFRPVVEVRLKVTPHRVRVYRPQPDLFEYLGRRMQYIADENTKLFVKDLVRFAPHARFSAGVLGLMMERSVPGSRFEGLAHLDAYARWFTAVGAPSLVERYRAATGARGTRASP